MSQSRAAPSGCSAAAADATTEAGTGQDEDAATQPSTLVLDEQTFAVAATDGRRAAGERPDGYRQRARHAGASNGSAKYCVSRATFPSRNSMMLTVGTGRPS